MAIVGGTSGLKGKRVAIVVARWNELITKELLEGAVETICAAGLDQPLIIKVSGTWEIPPIVAELVERGRADAIVVLGCILQGATVHSQLLASDVSSALMRLQTESRIPIGWGILTPESQEQAFERAGLKHGNKGREAAQAAIDSLSVLEQLRS